MRHLVVGVEIADEVLSHVLRVGQPHLARAATTLLARADAVSK